MKSILISLSIFFFTSAVFSQSGWIQQSSGINLNLRSVYFVNENTGWAAGDSGKILHTTNGGSNWILQNSNTTRAIDKILFTDMNNGMAVGNYYEYNPWCFDNSIRLITTNGGANWIIQFEGYSSNIEDFNIINNTYLIAYEGSDCYGTTGAIGKTTNNGINWFPFNSPGGGYAYKSLTFINADTGWAVGYRGTDFLLLKFQLIKTTNGGNNWIYLKIDSNTFNLDYFGSKMRFYNSNTGYVFKYYNRNLKKTTDGGYTWNQTDSIATSGKSDYCFINSDTGWCIGSGGSIIRTNNGGSNWNIQNSNVTNSLFSIYFVNENVGYIAGTNGMILKTITGGLTSVNQTESALPSEFKLYQNYPNPFNPVTNLEYGIPALRGDSKLGTIILKVYDVLGNEVRTLVNENKPAGNYKIEFNGYDLPSGLYFYSLSLNGLIVDTKRMILLK